MRGFILVPEEMRAFLVRSVDQLNPQAKTILAVLNSKPIKLPIQYEFSTEDGDRCRVVAWSKEHAMEQIREDRRFPGELTFESSCAAWPGTGVTRVVCPDFYEESAA